MKNRPNAVYDKASFETEPIIESFRIWQESFSNGVFQDKAIKMTLYDDVNDMFQLKGSIPMFANGSWAMNMYTRTDENTLPLFLHLMPKDILISMTMKGRILWK